MHGVAALYDPSTSSDVMKRHLQPYAFQYTKVGTIRIEHRLFDSLTFCNLNLFCVHEGGRGQSLALQKCNYAANVTLVDIKYSASQPNLKGQIWVRC